MQLLIPAGLRSCITAAARLMLALLERSITDAGGSYVYCDTDAMAIVASKRGGTIACPGGDHTSRDGRPAVKALSWDQVEQIRQRFTALNPYDPTPCPARSCKQKKRTSTAGGGGSCTPTCSVPNATASSTRPKTAHPSFTRSDGRNTA